MKALVTATYTGNLLIKCTSIFIPGRDELYLSLCLAHLLHAYPAHMERSLQHVPGIDVRGCYIYICIRVCVNDWQLRSAAQLSSPVTLWISCHRAERRTHSRGKHWLQGLRLRNGFADNYISSPPILLWFYAPHPSPPSPKYIVKPVQFVLAFALSWNKFSTLSVITFSPKIQAKFRRNPDVTGLHFSLFPNQSTEGQIERVRKNNEAQLMVCFWQTGLYVMLTAVCIWEKEWYG